MKFKKSIIVILFLIALVSIPISFAGDIQSDFESSQLSDNDDLIMNDNPEENLDGWIGEENADIEEDVPGGNIDLGENILESDDEGSQFEVSLSSSSSSLGSGLEDNLPNLDVRFSRIEINCSDENTIFVNCSYTGEDQDGTQSKPYRFLMDGFSQFFRYSNTRTNIFIAEGSYNVSSSVHISKSVNIIGENPQNTIIDGLNKTLIFSFSGSNALVNIINLTLANGSNPQGGAIHISRTYLNIINSIFCNNKAYYVNENATGKGGALYNDAGFVKIYNSTFTDNSIYGNYSKYGGAIYNHLGELSIFNSRFMNNALQGYWTSGGSIYSYNGFLTLFNSSITNTILNPRYHSLGGAICIWNGRNSYVINSTISGNTINGNYVFGSAIAHKGVLLKVINSTITDNYANGTSVENSAVYNINGIYDCENSIIENNAIKTVKSDLLLCLEDQLIISDIVDVNSLGDLPSTYDLREIGWVTNIKNQKPGGDCWAFAIYAALESYLLKNENISYDFSENNMKNSMYENGIYGTEWTTGGNHIMAFAYLLRGSGPVDESLDPFDAMSTSSPEDLEISKYITGFKYIPLRLNYSDNDQIKYAILEYGALYTSIYSSILSGNVGYSTLSNINNHAVAIVGWDDNYSRTNFGNAPPGDGAWIIKNSWGNYSGEGGYYYVSYYDATFPGVTDQFAAIAFTSVENLSEYRSVYQYDIVGNTFESLGYNSNTAWFANQFTAQSSYPLKAFGLYTFGSSSYLVNITVNGVSKLVQEGDLIGAGYHTVRLDNLVDLLRGDVFKITVRLTTPDSLFPIAIESKRSDYSNKVTAELNQSFISPDGINWYDIAQDTTVSKFYNDLNRIKLVETNVCLKAYTEYADDLSLEITSNASLYLEGDLIEFNITVLNYGDPSGKINISSIIDESVSIVSYSLIKGTFDEETKVWSMDNLFTNERDTLNLILRFNGNKRSINVSVSANSFSYSSNKDISNCSIVNYASHTEFLKIANVNTTVKSGKSVSISLIDAYGEALLNKNITISLISSNNNYSMNPLILSTNDGSVKFTLNLLAGKYKFMALFEGEGHYDPSNATFEVNVVKTKTQVIASNMNASTVVVSVDGKTGKYLKMTLKDANGKVLSGKNVQFIYNNTKYDKVTNKSGVARIQINRAYAGTYVFKICFLGDDQFSSSSKTVKVYVKRQSLKLTVSNKAYRLGNKKKYLTATLKNSKGRVIKYKKITFRINGKTYTAKTNSKGIAKVKVSLQRRKTYKFTVKFAQDKSYNSVSKAAKVVVR